MNIPSPIKLVKGMLIMGLALIHFCNNKRDPFILFKFVFIFRLTNGNLGLAYLSITLLLNFWVDSNGLIFVIQTFDFFVVHGLAINRGYLEIAQ